MNLTGPQLSVPDARSDTRKQVIAALNVLLFWGWMQRVAPLALGKFVSLTKNLQHELVVLMPPGVGQRQRCQTMAQANGWRKGRAGRGRGDKAAYRTRLE